MSETEETRDTHRTVLPSGEAEGAGNFAAEPATDTTAGPGNTAVATQMETGTLNQNENPSAAGEEGNRTGGDPAEAVVERQAASESQAVEVREHVADTDGGRTTDV